MLDKYDFEPAREKIMQIRWAILFIERIFPGPDSGISMLIKSVSVINSAPI